MDRKEFFAIAAREIKSFGFRVFVNINEPGKLPYYFGYFSDGQNIGYFQLGDFGGVRWSTVNKNGSFCSGFSCVDDGVQIQDMTADRLREAFQAVPRWYRMRKDDIRRGGVKKYASLDEFLNAPYLGSQTNAERLQEI